MFFHELYCSKFASVYLLLSLAFSFLKNVFQQLCVLGAAYFCLPNCSVFPQKEILRYLPTAPQSIVRSGAQSYVFLSAEKWEKKYISESLISFHSLSHFLLIGLIIASSSVLIRGYDS